MSMTFENTATLTVYGPLTVAVLKTFLDGVHEFGDDDVVTVRTTDSQFDGPMVSIMVRKS
jgi:hypothetical protein